MGGAMDHALLRSVLKNVCSKRKIKKIGIFFVKILGLILFSKNPLEGVLSVFDSSTYGLTRQLLSSTNDTLTEAKRMTQEIASLHSLLGKQEFYAPHRHDFFLKEMNILGDFSRLSFLELGKREIARDLLSHRFLFERVWLGHFTPEKPITLEVQRSIVHTRESLLKDSILNGVSFVNTQKEELKNSTQNLSLILEEANHNTTIRTEIITTNRLLSFIAYQLIQERALLIQLIETSMLKEGLNLPIALTRLQTRER